MASLVVCRYNLLQLLDDGTWPSAPPRDPSVHVNLGKLRIEGGGSAEAAEFFGEAPTINKPTTDEVDELGTRLRRFSIGFLA